jgi:hypothetical protein
VDAGDRHGAGWQGHRLRRHHDRQAGRARLRSATRTVGGVTKIFDATSNSFVPLASASNAIPASDGSGLAGLQTFVPSTYYAVTVH